MGPRSKSRMCRGIESGVVLGSELKTRPRSGLTATKPIDSKKIEGVQSMCMYSYSIWQYTKRAQYISERAKQPPPGQLVTIINETRYRVFCISSKALNPQTNRSISAFPSASAARVFCRRVILFMGL
ncbi:hypothetical protein EVAR_39905_1 [Eumeta japonica]|uniref:Uncharacterized protein n=1 Tax=Eumeta variegata TaxID=151549 RepID=A0A4C1WLW3_EUMVA|nr:hypothetical protein EVAR_39905_1 [Eumeta japonica]